MKQVLVFLFIWLNINFALAQGIRGVIKDELGDPLPYASVFVKEISSGTASNANGSYELQLPSGVYNITFQFVGYQALNRKVVVGDEYIPIDVQLSPQIEVLQEAVITGSSEDPAYSIMRKAIAKAPFHLMQCDSYTARVYIKGTGGLSKIPGLFRKMAEKEGVDTSRVFTSESVSEIRFERPTTFSERVISVRTSGEDVSGANPNAYINTSFYLPKVVESISPFSSRAFAYYRFRYMGNFIDRGSKVHKIEVIPREPGDYVFSGLLYIRDEFWNIHSLNLKGKVEFFDISLVQYYAPVEDEIWMPVSHQYSFSGSIMGFSGEYHYLASVSGYKLIKNKGLAAEVNLIDEEIEEAPPELNSIDDEDLNLALEEVFERKKEVSLDQFSELMEDYEEAEKETKGEEDVLTDYSFEIDSVAAKQDSAYWAKIRPVPLTPREVEGYRRDDSTYLAEHTDSSKYGEGKFDFADIFFGGRHRFGESSFLKFHGLIPRTRYNTVEGFNLDLSADLYLPWDSSMHYVASPSARYGFSSGILYARLHNRWQRGKPAWRKEFRLNGGRYIYQFYPDAINPLLNSVYSLFLQRNYMKLYQKEYVNLGASKIFRHKVKIDFDVEWSARTRLYNNSDLSVIDWEGREFSDNFPDNIETPPTVFNYSKALTSKIHLRWKPWLKFRRYNNELIPISESSPEFKLEHFAGWDNVLGSEVNFQRLETGINSEFALGVRATFVAEAEAGTYLTKEKMLFMDYKHFRGGLTELAPMDLVGRYRAIDYYLYSTNESWLTILSHVRFRKLLITRIPIIRLSGIKENIILNYLRTTNSPHYYEIGYGIDNIFRLFRLEFVQGFTNSEPARFVVRLGVASIFKFG